MVKPMLTIVVIADPIPSLLPAHDTSVALMEAAQRRGHRILVTTGLACPSGTAERAPVASHWRSPRRGWSMAAGWLRRTGGEPGQPRTSSWTAPTQS